MGAAPDPELMRAALREAEAARAEGGGPFGAVVARGGRVLATGRNAVVPTADPTAHAEVVAIRAACRVLGTHRLAGCELYTSCEPCPMCLAAAYWARLERVAFACTRDDAAAIGFDDAHLYRELALPRADRALEAVPLLRDEALEVFRAWSAMPDRQPY